jgi:hypothetical protein
MSEMVCHDVSVQTAKNMPVKLACTNHIGDSVVELRKGTKIPLQYICKTLNNITQDVGIFKLWVN